MKKVFKNTHLTCILQKELTVNEAVCGDITLTTSGVQFVQDVKVSKPCTRNPHIFTGKRINLLHKRDNTLQFTFKTMRKDEDLSLFAYDVYKELCYAILCLKSEK